MNMLATRVGIVVIGRNEGERLKRCLDTSLFQNVKVVYVDSGSTDGSVAYAESIGVDVVQLKTETPLSAARARNEGFRQLIQNQPDIEFVQFIDGDCELNKDWPLFAYGYLVKNDSCAIVTGRRFEKYPKASIYNILCDIEWKTPIGEAKECGGDFMIRRVAFHDVGGFNPHVVAGEEPDLCYRLRKSNWSIYRLDHPMTLHDANITQFSKWCRRQLRCGYSYAQVFELHWRGKENHFLRNILSTWFWALILPCSILILAVVVNYYTLMLFFIYPVHLLKIAMTEKKRIGNWKQSLIYALFIVIGRWPLLIGQLLFVKKKYIDKKHTIIEYKVR